MVTVGGNVTEIEAKTKHILVLNQLGQLFLPFYLGQMLRKEVKLKLDTRSRGIIPAILGSRWCGFGNEIKTQNMCFSEQKPVLGVGTV